MHRLLRFAGIGVLLLWPVGQATAEIVFTGRESTYGITFSDTLSFSDASARYDTSFTATGNSGDTDSLALNLKTNHTGFSWTGGGGLSVTNIVHTAGEATGDIASNGAAGTMQVGFDTAVSSTSFLQSWLLHQKNYLEFFGGGSGLVDPASPFSLLVTLPGDWSTMGTGQLQTQLININSNWTVDKMFTFDGTKTTFQAHIDEYNFQDPDLQFRLYATPEPMYHWVGVLAVGFIMVRRWRSSAPQLPRSAA